MLEPKQLLQLEKPGRYVGGEVNAVEKPITTETTRFAFCFPDVYLQATRVNHNIIRVDTFEEHKEDLKIYAAALSGAAAVEKWQG